ncbi:MAG TPA: nucleotide sugar dehydrogenase [Methylomirabilota bacterium]|jgi:UDP-N-acetyl-D-glucosamine dehydrogenase|nr:nucleotide sugar dehydrogenase [Methylomirabilota bacterium]
MVGLRDRIESRAARIAVMGQGYVGLPLAIEFAKVGFRVTGVDLDAEKVAALNCGESHIPDVPAATVRELVAAGRYSAATEMDVLGESDAIIICVPTPLRKAKDPDISFVLSAATEVRKRLRAGQLIVLESTTYPGTTEEMLLPMFAESGLQAGREFFLAFSPERIDPGNEQFKVKDIPKVVGGITPECTRMSAALYSQIVKSVLAVSSPTVAELAKLYENTFRSVNIALANEFALMCRYLGASVWEVIEAAATKPFGFMPFSPGPGIGGHCIPIDPIYLSWKLRLNGYEARFIALADDINRSMPHQVINLLMDGLNARRKCLNGAQLLILGVAYKRGVGDLRESPALDVIKELQRKGAALVYADPFVPTLAHEGLDLPRVTLSADLVRRQDAVVILTDHREFDYRMVVEQADLVIDSRNATRDVAAAPGRVIKL